MRPLAAVAVVLLAGCAAPPAEEGPPEGEEGPSGPFSATSAAFDHNAPIPRRHTCDAENVSPRLQVTGVPSPATTVALLLFDPDAPTPEAPLRNITHWFLWDAPVRNGSVAFPEDGVPAGTVENATGYTGPCPPPLSNAHRYIFWIFAVDGTLDLPPATPRAGFEAALDGRVVDRTILTGTYVRDPVG